MPELGRDTLELVIAMPEESAGSGSGYVNYAEYKSKQTIVQPLPLERAGPLLFKLITSLEICTQGCVIELARRRPGKPRASFESAESPQPLCVK